MLPARLAARREPGIPTIILGKWNSRTRQPSDQLDDLPRREHLASYATGVIATLVAIGGLYLATALRAGTAIAVVIAGTVAIWIARASSRLVMGRGHHPTSSCVPEGLTELRRSWPVGLAALPPVLSLAGAAAKLWSVTVGLHLGQALGICGLIATGLLTARRLKVTGWPMVSYVVWLALSGLIVVGLEVLSRAV